MAEKSNYLLKTTWLYYLGRSIFRVLFKFFWRYKYYGVNNIPKDTGVIIAPNHRSYADPPLVGSCMGRPLYFMAKEELFKVPILGFLIKRTNAFAVKRNTADLSAFKNAFELLKNKKALLVFPEGTRSKEDVFGKARAGIGMIAAHSKAPVVPVRIYNTFNLLKFKKIKVVFGKPIYPDCMETKKQYEEFAVKILDAVKAL